MEQTSRQKDRGALEGREVTLCLLSHRPTPEEFEQNMKTKQNNAVPKRGYHCQDHYCVRTGTTSVRSVQLLETSGDLS